MSDPLIWDWFFVVLSRIQRTHYMPIAVVATISAAVAVAAVLHIDEQTKRKPFAIKAHRDHTITL